MTDQYKKPKIMEEIISTYLEERHPNHTLIWFREIYNGKFLSVKISDNKGGGVRTRMDKTDDVKKILQTIDEGILWACEQ